MNNSSKTIKMPNDIEYLNELSAVLEYIELKLPILDGDLRTAFDLAVKDTDDPESCLVKNGILLERIIKDLYSKLGLKLPKKEFDLKELISVQFTNKLPARIGIRMKIINGYRNLGAHDNGLITVSDAKDCLRSLIEILEWYCEEYFDLGKSFSQYFQKMKRELTENLEYLPHNLPVFDRQLKHAFDYAVKDTGDPSSCVVKCGVILEKTIKEIFLKIGKEPSQIPNVLSGMINHEELKSTLPPRIEKRMNIVREYRNLGPHDKGRITVTDAKDCLRNLVEILEWYCKEYQPYQEKSNPDSFEKPEKEESENGVKRPSPEKNNKSLFIAALCFILLILPLCYFVLKETSTQKPVIGNNIAIPEVNQDIQNVLKLAYTSNLESSAPSAAVAVMTKPGIDKSASWKQIQNGDSLSSADNYLIRFQPEIEAYFYVIQIDSKGKMDWLFPKNNITSLSVGKNPVPAGKWTYVPGENIAFHLDENLGMEHIYVIATQSSWDELEKILQKSGSTETTPVSIQTAFNMQTRGAGGTRYLEPVKSDTGEVAAKNVRQLITGKTGVLVYEKWFKHVPPPKN